jgi:hypothetical protein
MGGGDLLTVDLYASMIRTLHHGDYEASSEAPYGSDRLDIMADFVGLKHGQLLVLAQQSQTSYVVIERRVVQWVSREGRGVLALRGAGTSNPTVVLGTNPPTGESRSSVEGYSEITLQKVRR